MPEIKSNKILKGLKEIATAIGVSEKVVAGFIKAGLPAWNVNGTWYSHIDKLDDYFASGCTKYRGKIISVNENGIDDSEFEKNLI